MAVGLLTSSTFPIFVTFMQPYLLKEGLRFFDVLMAGLVFAGLTLVLPSLAFSSKVMQGAFWGIVSGFTLAVLSLLNRKYVRPYYPLVIASYQNAFATLFLFPFGIFARWSLEPRDILLLGVLGILCTTFAHDPFVKSLVYIKAQLASIIPTLEAVYGIIFAFTPLGEVPASRTALGVIIILSATVLATGRETSLRDVTYLA